MIALSLECPLPVKASEPWKDTWTEWGVKLLNLILFRNNDAATKGPIV